MKLLKHCISKYDLRHHGLILKATHSAKLDFHKHFFSNRIVNTWNKLPQDIVNSSTLSSFKLRLKRHRIASFKF